MLSMMVMHANNGPPFQPKEASLQGRRVQKRQNRESRVIVDTSVFSFPSTAASSVVIAAAATTPRPVLNEIINRPQEGKPSKRHSKADGNSADNYSFSDKRKDSFHNKNVSNSETLSPKLHTRADDDAFAIHNQHRRPRSHFSIPDVIVTSSLEDGEERHYEMQVEPNNRKMKIYEMSTGMYLMNTTSIQLTAAQRVALDSKSQESKAASYGKATKMIKGKLKMPASLATNGRSSSEGEIRKDEAAKSNFGSSSSSSVDNRIEKRSRRSSLSGLFTRKDREAAIATTALPPSPTVQWQQFHSSLPQTNVNIGESMALASPPLPSMHSSSARNSGRKDLRKEEQSLIKELEKIDKMVRKHDKEVVKAAKKGVESTSIEGQKHQGKTKMGFRRISVFRAANSGHQLNKSSMPLYVKTSSKAAEAFATTEKQQQSSLVAALHTSTDQSRISRRNSSEDSAESSPNASWMGDNWTDLPSPVDEQLPSLAAGSSFKSGIGIKEEAVDLPAKRSPSLQRKGSALQRVTSGKSIGRQRSLRRGSPDSITTAKRLSLLSTPLRLSLDLGADMGWKDALDSSMKEDDMAAKQVLNPSSKRITMLDSLYKDIEDMESNFQKERDAYTSRQSYSITPQIESITPVSTVIAASRHRPAPSPPSQSISRIMMSPDIINKKRADSLPSSVIHHQVETILSKSTSAPTFF